MIIRVCQNSYLQVFMYNLRLLLAERIRMRLYRTYNQGNTQAPYLSDTLVHRVRSLRMSFR